MASNAQRPRDELEELLQALLDAENARDAARAVDDLVALGAEGARAVTRRIRHLSIPAQRAAVMLGEKVGGRAGLVLLEQLLQLGDESVENPAIYAVGNIGEPDGVRILLGWLGTARPGEQLDAILLSLVTIIATAEPAAWKAAIAPVDDNVLRVALDALDEPARERGWSDELAPLQSAIETELERRRLRTFGTLLDPDADALGRAYLRHHAIQAMEERLAGQHNRSLILVGPAGAGKTALVHELCHRLGPDGVADRVLQTSTGLLLVGTRFLGEWQTRVRELLDVTAKNPRLLVYITDINNLLGAGTTARSEENIADFLAPYIQKGTLALIGECTHEELRRGIEQRPAFRRLFQVIRVEGALPPDALDITMAVGQALAENTRDVHGRRIEFGANFFPRLMEIADQFRSSVARPGRAIDLMRATVKRLRRETAREAGERDDALVVEPHHIVETLARDSGVPRTLLDDREQLDLDDVREFLSERVIGQPDAVDAVVDLVTLIKAGLTDPTQPTGVLFFVGPTGVGKTELAKTLAEYLFGSADRMIRLDMSEFTEFSSIDRLIGSPMASEWSPHRQGLLTGKIRQQPMSVVLLDEFEKAHRAVFDLLLQVMDDGRLTDAAGRVANFTQAIIIMTSNLGGAELVGGGIGFTPGDGQPRSHIPYKRELERVFRPEFINRIGHIVPFWPLDADAMEQIVRREVAKVLSRSGLVRRNITVEVGPSVVDLLLDKGFDPRYGARPLKREVERRVLLPLGRAIVEMGVRAEEALLRLIARDDVVHVDAIGAETSVELPAAEPATLPEARTQPDKALEQVLEEVDALRERCRDLETRAIDSGLADRKSRLVEASGQPAFWDDPALARRTLSEIHWIERILTGVERVRKRSDDLLHFASSAGRRPDERLARARNRLAEIDAEAALLSMALRCRQEDRRRDAFVRIERIDTPPSPLEPDPVLTLAQSYIAFARRHRYHVDVLDERLDDGVLVTATLRLEGLCPFGILESESGIHRVNYWEPGHDGRRYDKTTAFCRVEVLPVAVGPRAPRVGRGDIVTTRERSTTKGRLIPHHRTRLEMRHDASGLTLTTSSDKDPDEAEEMLVELLRARLATGGEPRDEDPGVRPVRTYGFGARTSVRDDETGVRAGTDALLAGEIEPFLEARISAEDAPAPVISVR